MLARPPSYSPTPSNRSSRRSRWLVLAHLVADGVYDDPGAYERIVYLDLPNAERQGRFLSFNVLRQSAPPHTIASNVMEAMHRAWPALAGGVAPMFDTLVQNGVKALISNDLPLPALYRFLTDKDYRDRLLRQETDRDVVSVFHDWYDRLPPRDQLDTSGSTLRRVNQLTFDPVLKYSLGQSETLLNFREILDCNRSVIVNLALNNAEARRLLGCLLTVGAEQWALSRAELPPEERFHSHHLIIDEFSEFIAQSEEALSRMLSLTRKYGLYLVMAHQTWSQASERLRGALQNVGIEAAFRLGRADAEYSATILGHVNPMHIKHEVKDEVALERTHPTFFSLAEQWEYWVQALQELRPRQAYIAHHTDAWWRRVLHRPTRRVVKVKTLSVPDPTTDRESLARVEDYYLRTCFRPQAEIEQVLAHYRTMVRPTLTTRRSD